MHKQSNDPYGKEAIIQILMERDELSPLEAANIVDDVQYQITDAVDNDCTLEELEDIIDDYLGLEPDYLECFLLELM